jgi:hypothetical protein
MTDHVVTLPASLTNYTSVVKQSTLTVIAALTAFATGEQPTLRDIEYELAVRFAGVASAPTMTDTLSWLRDHAISPIDLGAEIAQLAASNPSPLHQALQQQNDAGLVQLVHLADRTQLLDIAGNRIDVTPGDCYAMRVGYSEDQPVGYYYLSLPGHDRAQTPLSWASIVAARPDAGIAVGPPQSPIDKESLMTAVHILEQSLAAANAGLATANQAHATIVEALGGSSVSSSSSATS